MLKTTPHEIRQWLESKNCTECKPCFVTIESQSWPACQYVQTLTYEKEMACVQWGEWGEHKAGETYTNKGIYCVGPLPKAFVGPRKSKYPRGQVCFPLGGLDWYIAAYMPLSNPHPEFAPHHPFGENFILAPWDIPGETIDKWERRPYRRIVPAIVPA